MRELSRAGNTVLVIEHDAAIVRACDRVIELGPGAGKNGGPDPLRRDPSDLAKRSDPPPPDAPGRRPTCPPRPPQAVEVSRRPRRSRQQPRSGGCEDPARRGLRDHGAERIGQIDLGGGDPLPRRRARARRLGGGSPGPSRRARRARRAHPRHPRRSIAARAHRARQPGHLHPRLGSDRIRARFASEPRCRGSGPHPGPFFVQRRRPELRPLAETCGGEGYPRPSRCSSSPTSPCCALSARGSASSRRCSRSLTAERTWRTSSR